MTYELTLPNAFPWKFQSDRTTIRYLVRKLIETNRDDAPFGSSFAVTVDAGEGQWNLWLSDVSKNYLVAHMAHIERNLIDTEYMK